MLKAVYAILGGCIRIKPFCILPEWWNGIHEGLKILWSLTLWVRVPPSAPRGVVLRQLAEVEPSSGCSSSVERSVWDREVGGPIPLTPTQKDKSSYESKKISAQKATSCVARNSN